MITQFDNQLINSFLYYLDYKIINNGSGYQNKSSNFQYIGQTFGGYYTYSTPFNQFIADRSIPGPNIITSISISGVSVPPGASGIHAIDYFNGRIYSSGRLATNAVVSGNFAAKSFITDIAASKFH